MSEHPGPIFSPADVVCFGEAHPVVAVLATGETQFWLIDYDHLDEHDGKGGSCCTGMVPDHEQLGPLPRRWQRGIQQCRATSRTTGARCRNSARPPSRYCHEHAAGESDR